MPCACSSTRRFLFAVAATTVRWQAEGGSAQRVCLVVEDGAISMWDGVEASCQRRDCGLEVQAVASVHGVSVCEGDTTFGGGTVCVAR